MHAIFDAMSQIIEENDIRPEEIESIKAFGESFVLQPTWLNTDVRHARDAQFSMVHGLAVGASRIPPGPRWLDPEVMHSPAVADLMAKVTYDVHPDYTAALAANAAARRSRVEVTARGTTWAGERNYPKGSPSPDPSSYMTNDELQAKFRNNVAAVLSDDAAAVIEAVAKLEDVTDIRAIMDRVRPTS